jgi:hypothetical protein
VGASSFIPQLGPLRTPARHSVAVASPAATSPRSGSLRATAPATFLPIAGKPLSLASARPAVLPAQPV